MSASLIVTKKIGCYSMSPGRSKGQPAFLTDENLDFSLHSAVGGEWRRRRCVGRSEHRHSVIQAIIKGLLPARNSVSNKGHPSEQSRPPAPHGASA